MEENIEFERCIEFLVRMIEKYGEAIYESCSESNHISKAEEYLEKGCKKALF